MTTSPSLSPQAFSLVGSLARHPYFEELSIPRLQQLAGSAAPRAFAAGETLFLEGDPSAGLWIVECGSVKVYKVNPEGIEHILHLLTAGDSFNEIAAIDGGPNPASAAALSPATGWVIPSAMLREALMADPDLALAVIGALTGRVRTLVQHIEDLALYSVTARLARYLLQAARSPSPEGPGITRAAIAAHLGTTPETVSRVLKALQDAGAIRFDRHRIVIADPGALRDISLI